MTLSILDILPLILGAVFANPSLSGNVIMGVSCAILCELSDYLP